MSATTIHLVSRNRLRVPAPLVRKLFGFSENDPQGTTEGQQAVVYQSTNSPGKLFIAPSDDVPKSAKVLTKVLVDDYDHIAFGAGRLLQKGIITGREFNVSLSRGKINIAS